MRNEPQQLVRNVGLADSRYKPRQSPDVLHPDFAARHLRTVRVATHLLHGHAVGHPHATTFRQVVHLREQIAKPRSGRLQPLGTAQHQRLVHETVGSHTRLTLHQLYTSAKQFFCCHGCKITKSQSQNKGTRSFFCRDRVFSQIVARKSVNLQQKVARNTFSRMVTSPNPSCRRGTITLYASKLPVTCPPPTGGVRGGHIPKCYMMFHKLTKLESIHST